MDPRLMVFKMLNLEKKTNLQLSSQNPSFLIQLFKEVVTMLGN